MDLATEFCGLHLPNPFLVASSPATETVRGIMACAEAGAAAIITKSIGNYDPRAHPRGFRRMHLDGKGLWATSTFRRETLTLEAGIRLLVDASMKTSPPIIASVTAGDLEPDSWLPMCAAMEQSGAAAIQLDLFYIPPERSYPERVQALKALFRTLTSALHIPILPKLNIDITPEMASEAIDASGIAALSFLDSVTVPAPFLLGSLTPAFRFVTRPNKASLFGAWQLPLTLRYTCRLAQLTHVPLCAGGGMMSAADALQAILIGATTVQFATMVLLGGFSALRRTIDDFEVLVSRTGRSLSELRGIAGRQMDSEETLVFEDVCAVVDPASCTGCGDCIKPALCHSISLRGTVAIPNPDLCDGCSLCTYLCQQGAISLVRRTSQ